MKTHEYELYFCISSADPTDPFSDEAVIEADFTFRFDAVDDEAADKKWNELLDYLPEGKVFGYWEEVGVENG